MLFRRHSILLFVLALALLPLGVQAEETPPANPSPAAALPAPRVLEETVPVTLKDSGRAEVTLRVPVALYRPANAFRLYGFRPLTLHSRDRRRDLYRDAFLELATRSRLAPGVNLWTPLIKQLDLLTSGATFGVGGVQARRPAAGASDGGLEVVLDFTRQAESLPGYRHVSTLSKSLGGFDLTPSVKVDVAEPVVDALRLRALATDEAEQRLLLIGEALKLDAPGTDPALRDGYRDARAEFDHVRQGLWPAIAGSLKRNQGKLIAAAARDLALSRLGAWAVFGYVGWKGVEGIVNVEYHGQYSTCLATVAARLAEAAAGEPKHLPAALYAEYALNYQLTEALKGGQLMDLKPSGGRTAPDWQIRFSERSAELRKSLVPQ